MAGNENQKGAPDPRAFGPHFRERVLRTPGNRVKRRPWQLASDRRTLRFLSAALGWFLATCPNKKWRDGKAALPEAEIACRLTQWKNGTYLDNMAAALAEAGDFEQAMKREEQALKMVQAGDRKIFEKHLASYRQHRPWLDQP